MITPVVFHSGATETILFDFWKIDCALTMVVSMIVVLVVSFFKEFLRVYRSNLHESKMNAPGNLILFTLQTFLSYSLMAIFMMLNVWLCLAVVIGEVFSNMNLAELRLTEQEHQLLRPFTKKTMKIAFVIFLSFALLLSVFAVDGQTEPHEDPTPENSAKQMKRVKRYYFYPGSYYYPGGAGYYGASHFYGAYGGYPAPYAPYY
ncbi:hypothetical protein QR680_003518 [Steinernema hermaphroditum]|uniref:Copper transport protein n=1 Tax=Steinernema hermaphroditum TaxID=289476 RepID=A0AA39LSE9_9BILA|nr:hypothetical protein QR680_003518 [Steinernema hermaphroditum]